MKNKLINENFFKLNNVKSVALISLLWLIIFIIFFFYFDKEIFFICNDSFQYLSIAKKIYQDGAFNQLINYALNLYYNELAIFNYNFNDLKPYHFPSYSVYLSLFYHVFNNDKIVVYLSQYIAFVIFSISSFLILSHYVNKQKALIITISSMIFSPIIYYVSDSGKEIMCSALSLLLIYLTLYKKNNLKPFNLFFSCLVIIFLSITRSFYLILGFLIAFYLAMPPKNKKKTSNIELSIKSKSLVFLLFFIIPLIFYIYCYFYLNLHYFLYDNRTDIYGGRNLNDLMLRIFNNLILSYPLSIILAFKLGKEKIDDLGVINLYLTFLLTSNALLIYYYSHFKNFKKNKLKEFFINIQKIKISRLGIINFFSLAILLSISFRFSIMGYRLLIFYLPFAFLIFYQILITRSPETLISKYKIYIIATILTILIYNNLINLSHYKLINNNIIQINNSILNKIKNTNSKKIIIDNSYPTNFVSLPLFNLYPKDIYFFSTWRIKELCDDVEKYHMKNIDFDLVFLKKEFKNCDFFNQKFILNESNQFGFIYIKNH